MYGKDPAKLFFGQHAVHVPMWMKVQDQGDGTVVFVGASRTQYLRYGSERTHQLILGEVIVRPHLVIGSDDFRGYGLSNLAREMDVEAWLKGDLILDPIGRLEKLRQEGK